ncbi:hypothetical protein [Chryseobacterium gambrini]|uniref:TonB protein C-terminal n=1 Tax=Chryseobacterium gambrini TaxID=373672 RepID=A0A1N7LNN8_9FLAO|nr:hypothetical protein [Chryseobacterium gambrini]MBL7878274.1 hypothetical protein [Chryseobacterium gambrini]SIS75341.1 hypothetical protein SAMN05421785_102372 [Chryseobacterium gambrini]
MKFKKYLIAFATIISVTSFAQNTRSTLQKTVNKIYTDIRDECGKDLDLLNVKYEAIEKKSPERKLSQADINEYSKQFDALKISYNQCVTKNQSIKIEKLKALLAKVEEENKKEYIPSKNILQSTLQPFSQDIIRKKMVNMLAGHDLFEGLDVNLQLRLSFVLDIDGLMKEVKITGTDNEEIILFTTLSFYSITEVFQPKLSDGKPVRSPYTMPLTFMATE